MKSLQFLSLLHLISQATNTIASLPASNSLTCSYDPFYHLRPTPLPTCSLSPPQSSLDASPELLSFEEWKQARLAAMESPQQQKAVVDSDHNSSHSKTGDSEEPVGAGVERATTGSDSADGVQSTISLVRGDDSDSHFRVPLTDRFNYASQDCTARIYSAHKGAKSPSAVLSSKKDRYLLSPCAAKEKFVIVELCDDVRIDTVQLANYEFFSGVFKDIKISLSESSPGDPQAWIDAGTYRAKNIRAVQVRIVRLCGSRVLTRRQSFHPPAGRQKFYRYIRVDFLSYYGNEFYCPVSLLRVYGLTHMEDYRWAGWQTGTETSTEAQQIKATETVSEVEAVPTTEVSITDTSAATTTPEESAPTIEEPPFPDNTVTPAAQSTGHSSVGETSASAASTELAKHDKRADASTTPSSDSAQDIVSSLSTAKALAVVNSSETVVLSTTPTHPSPDHSSAMTTSTIASNTTSSISKDQPTTKASVAVAPTPSSNGGENIYRTIMNRLQMLEANSTLGIKYMEEQTRSLRNVVRKLEEDVGRLDALVRPHEVTHSIQTDIWSQGKRQQHLFERTVLEMEKQRKEMFSEMRRLAVDVQTLSREV